ncbi:aggrecan core protein-like isoform X2 [Dreissena polymorpha]|uniref:C-type lectin domain-containing protein n=1 Tax=Dreissena polymorpha TaxID=45954 RepID=A0A9D4DA89_DREPO|nr:aggrecan core protein-like isoform X2 [Dreissena polymorpha]KAH3741170.1 hypothetical protein DPMN_047890 [Dreissena polymorpha]
MEIWRIWADTGSTEMNRRASVVLLLLIWIPIVRGDFPCLCCYSLEASVYQEKTLNAGTLGYMYEFDCKPLYDNLTIPDNSWTAIQFEHKIGYVPMTQDQVIQQCPGSIPTGDQVAETSSATTSTTHLSSTESPTTHSPSTGPQTTSPLTAQPTLPQPSTAQSIKTQPPTHHNITTQITSTYIHETQPIETPSPSTSQPATQSPTTQTPITQLSTHIQPITLQQPLSTTKQFTTTPFLITSKESTIQTTKPTAHPSLTTIHIKPPLTTLHHANTHMPSTTHAPANSCPENVVTHASDHQGYVMSRGYSCFEFVNHTKTWNDAEGSCRHRGGHLTSIKNQAEENALLVFMYDIGVKNKTWIGLTDQHHEHRFIWSSGLPLYWTNWIPGNQNHRYFNDDDCVTLVPDTSMVSASSSNSLGTWDDVHCDIKKPFICRFESNPWWHLSG